MSKDRDLNLMVLSTMSGADLERYAWSGNGDLDYLCTEVIKHLELPAQWKVSVEKEAECESNTPIHLRVINCNAQEIIVNVLSSNVEVSNWCAYINFCDSEVCWVYTNNYFDPHSLRNIFEVINAYIQDGVRSSDELVSMLRSAHLVV